MTLTLTNADIYRGPLFLSKEQAMSAVFFAFDVETTGLEEADEIISFAYRVLDNDLAVITGDIFYVWPDKRSVNAEAAAVNGYSAPAWTAKHAVPQAEFAGIIKQILSPFRGLIPLGHNVKFD